MKWGIAGALALALITGITIVAHQEIARHRLPPVTPETTQEKYAEASGAFSGADLPRDSAQVRAVGATFDRLMAAVKGQDARAAADCFDPQRMYREMDRKGTLPSLSSADERQFIAGMALGMGRTLISQPSWRRFKITRVRPLQGGNEVVAYLRIALPRGIVQKTRFWLRHEGSVWKIYDVEDLQGGIRASVLMAEIARQSYSAGGALPPSISAVQSIRSAFDLLLQGNVTGAESLLHSIDSVSLPAEIDGLRWLAWGALHQHQLKLQEALDNLDKAEELHPDMPEAKVLRAQAFIELHRNQEAQDQARQYIDEVGGDYIIYALLGKASEALGKPSEAIDAYAKGLDDEPDSVECFKGLRRLLPLGRKRELAQRFAACTSKHTMFSILAADAVRQPDVASMDVLLSAYSADGGDDPLFGYYTAESLMLHGKYAEAAFDFKANYPLAAQRDKIHAEREYVRAMMQLGDPVSAYRTAPDSDAAFRQVADALLVKPDLNALGKLIEARRKDKPSDPLLNTYSAKLRESSQPAATQPSSEPATQPATNPT